MQYANIHDAKTNLSKYVTMVEDGNETVMICRNGKPVVKMIKYQSQHTPLKFGLMEGQIEISDDFDDELPEEMMKYFR